MESEPNPNREQNFQAEKEWHEHVFYLDSGHWTSNPLFASRERHWLHNEVQKIRFYGELYRYIREKSYDKKARVLLAPVGGGGDVYYLQGIYREVNGIDISPIALANCPGMIVKREGDISASGYEADSFDIIVCSQFLHHVHSVGFAPFVKEFHRLLRRGGVLAILEPSALYPFGQIMAFARKLMGNVTGLVEGERPVLPSSVTAVLEVTGFERIRVRGLTFSHVRFPCIIQNLMDSLDYPFRLLPPFRYFANSIGWFCEKP